MLLGYLHCVSFSENLLTNFETIIIIITSSGHKNICVMIFWHCDSPKLTAQVYIIIKNNVESFFFKSLTFYQIWIPHYYILRRQFNQTQSVKQYWFEKSEKKSGLHPVSPYSAIPNSPLHNRHEFWNVHGMIFFSGALLLEVMWFL